MKNFDWCVYTYKHRRAFVYVVNRLIKDPVLKTEMLKRARVHDMDKMLLYLFWDQDRSQRYHVEHVSHHLESGRPQSRYDMVETVIDYECAPYTKPDKPLNAYDFVCKLLDMEILDREKADQLLDIMHEFGIDFSYTVLDDREGMEYVHALGEVTEEMILMEVLQYVRENPDSLLPLLDERTPGFEKWPEKQDEALPAEGQE